MVPSRRYRWGAVTSKDFNNGFRRCLGECHSENFDERLGEYLTRQEAARQLFGESPARSANLARGLGRMLPEKESVLCLREWLGSNGTFLLLLTSGGEAAETIVAVPG